MKAFFESYDLADASPCVQTELDSFLIEISALILAFKDEDGQPLVNKILDKTGMKGTGGHLASAITCPLFQEDPRQVFHDGSRHRSSIWSLNAMHPR